MATTYTFTLRSGGGTLADASVQYQGASYDINQAPPAGVGTDGTGTITTTDAALASLLRGATRSDGLALLVEAGTSDGGTALDRRTNVPAFVQKDSPATGPYLLVKTDGTGNPTGTFEVLDDTGTKRTLVVGSGGAVVAAKTLYGDGAPAAGLGNDGDSYVDTTNRRRYAKKASGAWPGSYTDLTARDAQDNPLAGAWNCSAGTLDTTLTGLTGAAVSDMVTTRFLLPVPVSGVAVAADVYFTLATPLDTRGKVVKLPVVIDSVLHWNTIAMKMTAGANLTGGSRKYNIGGNAKVFRAMTFQVLSIVPEMTYNDSGGANAAAITQIGLNIKDDGTIPGGRTIWLGTPILAN